MIINLRHHGPRQIYLDTTESRGLTVIVHTHLPGLSAEKRQYKLVYIRLCMVNQYYRT